MTFFFILGVGVLFACAGLPSFFGDSCVDWTGQWTGIAWMGDVCVNWTWTGRGEKMDAKPSISLNLDYPSIAPLDVAAPSTPTPADDDFLNHSRHREP